MERVNKEVQQILGEYQEIQAEIQTSSPQYAGLMQPRPLTIDDIQHRLIDDNTALLEYMLGDEQSYVWIITSSTFGLAKLPSRSETERTARHLYDLLRTPPVVWDTRTMSRYYSTAATLSRMVVAPVPDKIVGKRLAVVADGFLSYIPFATLLDEGSSTPGRPTPLIVNHEIVNLPSVETLGLLRSEDAKRRQAPKVVAVLADPVFLPGDERLNGSVRPTATETHN